MKKIFLVLLSFLFIFIGFRGICTEAEELDITPQVDFTSLPTELYKDSSGQINYKIHDVLGVSVDGNITFWSNNEKILQISSKGEWNALETGNVSVTYSVNLSEDSLEKLKQKYPNDTFIIKDIGNVINFNIVSKIETTSRLYNPNSGEHFYTNNYSEKLNLFSHGWVDEGHAWTSLATSDIPVYRLYNPNFGNHHYTKSVAENNLLIDLGWKYEGIAFYSFESTNNPVFRLYNPNSDAGSHFLTLDLNERNSLINLGWRDEGVAFNA